MNNRTLRMNPLSSGIALALGAVGIAPVVAQTPDAEEAGMMEEVMVTGIRRSLEDSAAIKRDSDGVVDAILIAIVIMLLFYVRRLNIQVKELMSLSSMPLDTVSGLYSSRYSGVSTATWMVCADASTAT